jgi:ArsR family transcriptional regulator
VRILALLRAGELCVCDLVGILSVTQSTLSTHLRVLRDAGLVSTRRAGKWIHYSLSPRGLRLAESISGAFADELAADPVVRRDAARATRRCGC